MNLYQNIAKNKRRTAIYIIIFFIFVLAIGWFFDYYYQGGGAGIFVALVFTIPTALTSYYASDKVALAVNGAEEINPDKSDAEKQLYRLVENVAITAGIAIPRVYIIEDDAMNAFSTGRDPKHASVAFTTGILRKLDKLELEGVIAHEISHVKNYDIRLSTVIVILVGLIALLSDFFLRFSFFGGRRRSNNNDSGAGVILLIIGLVLIILSPIIAQLISLAVSRRREFLADSSGALLTRYPEGLAKALQKISQDTDPLDHANNATMHLYIASPAVGRGGVSKFFSTHPPIEERIQALMGMDVEKFEKEYLKK